jgi:SAM-dependent methyltransferase
MFLEESLWVKDRINEIGNVRSILDIGSGDIHYREVKQPYILEMYSSIGIKIDTLDLKESDGIDYVRDISEKEGVKGLKKYDVLLVCSLLEHIIPIKIDTVLENIYRLLKNKGCCIVTVPFNISYHPSPIDNGLSPDIDELEIMFSSRFEKVITEKVICSHYREPYISNPHLLPLPEVTCGVMRKRL